MDELYNRHGPYIILLWEDIFYLELLVSKLNENVDICHCYFENNIQSCGALLNKHSIRGVLKLYSLLPQRHVGANIS